MSDGNFNRSLLPHTPYHSGLQTGKAMARMQAMEAFKRYLHETQPEWSENEIQEQAERFRTFLYGKK